MMTKKSIVKAKRSAFFRVHGYKILLDECIRMEA